MFNIIELVDMEQVVEDLKYDLQHNGIYLLKDVKKVNNNIMVTCPYHAGGQESNPSMGISLKEHNKGTCHCFTCGTTRSFTELVSDVFDKNDFGIYGIKWLYKKYDFVSEEARKPIDIIPTKKEVKLTPRDWGTLAPYSVLYNPTDYLTNRGISKIVQQIFMICYDPQSRHIIFPMSDEKGNLIYWQSRSVDVKFFYIEENAPKAYILFGLYQVNLYMKEESIDNSKLYVVESAIDAMYLWTYGKMAVATSQAIPTDYQIELIRKLPFKTIVAAQDNDEAGWRGAHRLREKLSDKLVYRYNNPNYQYKDMNDLPPDEIVKEENLSLVW